MSPERERKEAAAITIQQQWRRRRAIHKQEKFQEATDQGILDIQSALRGHLIRKKVLLQQSPLNVEVSSHGKSKVEAVPSDASDSDSSETSMAVERIQSALRGHAARQMALQDLQR